MQSIVQLSVLLSFNAHAMTGSSGMLTEASIPRKLDLFMSALALANCIMATVGVSR